LFGDIVMHSRMMTGHRMQGPAVGNHQTACIAIEIGHVRAKDQAFGGGGQYIQGSRRPYAKLSA
jgi:hypothetical protein